MLKARGQTVWQDGPNRKAEVPSSDSYGLDINLAWSSGGSDDVAWIAEPAAAAAQQW